MLQLELVLAVGVIAQGKPLRGFWNPSFGHMSLAPHKDDPCPQGFVPFMMAA